MLLAVDLGLRTGVAVFTREGRLLRYASQNYGNRERLRRGAAHVVDDAGDELEVLIVEGDADLARIWRRHAERRGIRTFGVAPERWRERLLVASQRRSGADAKRAADTVARAVIEWSGARRPTSLRHDAAEAICIGLWGVLELGWLDEPPL